MTAFKTQIQQEEAKVVNKRNEELQAQQKAMERRMRRKPQQRPRHKAQ